MANVMPATVLSSSSALIGCGGTPQLHGLPNSQRISTLAISKSPLRSRLDASTCSSISSSPFVGFAEHIKSRSSRTTGGPDTLRLWRRGRRGGGGGRVGVKCKAKAKVAEEERTPPTADTNVFVRMAWYGSEAFGKVASVFRPKKSSEEEEEEEGTGPVARKDAVELIRADLIDRSYFVTGDMAMGIYEKNCEFADPFVSFKGLKRFKQNVSNLGSFMEESSLKILDWQEKDDRLYAKWRFKCVIALPWRPILAASGSTEYFFSTDSGKICKHVESWDISPVDGLKQLIKPNPKRKAAKK